MPANGRWDLIRRLKVISQYEAILSRTQRVSNCIVSNNLT